MNDVVGQVLDYLGYKNKQKSAEWAERLWQQHLQGTPEDIRADEDRRRYDALQERAASARVLASNLHRRRMRAAPRFDSTPVDASPVPAIIVHRAAAG
ncbi:MAG: hypothetical protein IT486_08535 [Gammaproteobacteria bacterium]|nr:hypothetical protein [Gammaproteobacteria bacterium]